MNPGALGLGFEAAGGDVNDPPLKSSPLQPRGDGIWIAEGPEVCFHGFPYPTRTVIVRLAAGDLWVWSPVEPNAELLAVVARLGPVAHLVSPNRLHHLFLPPWHERFPLALLWGPASTIAKRPDLPFREALTGEAPAPWRCEIDQAWFRGSPFLDEIVFFHKASGTVLFGDLVQAFSDAYLRARWKPWQRRLARVSGITVSAGAHAPLDLRLSFIRRQAARAARDKVLDWDVDQVVMAHGECVVDDAGSFLAASLSWLG